MVHALHEVHRVSRPGAFVIDLRPALVHRRIAIRHGGRLRPVAAMQERFDIDRAANAAVAKAIRTGLFRQLTSRQIRFNRVLSTLKEFEAWIHDFIEEGLPGHEQLIEAVRRAYRRATGTRTIIVQGPLQMRVLRTQEAPR
jgi:hypothetical protein